ncbi:MAG: hypothetical protein EXQ96_05355 [Alphaproteobacteria bacterium]|nr:hypothetical protein [Alphaproteobacteria bacterium]
MNLSTDRILVTHTGSLPRPDDLLRLLVARDQRQPYDQGEFERTLARAVADVVNKQIAFGIDVVNDGELSKIGYGAYVKERLTGFEGEEAPRIHAADLDEFPVDFRRLYGPEGFDKMKRPMCVAPLKYVGLGALAADLANLRKAGEVIRVHVCEESDRCAAIN